IAQQVIDYVITPAAENGEVFTDDLVRLLGIFSVLMLVTAVLRYFSYLILTKAANGIVKVLRDQSYKHLQTLPISYFDHLPAGKVVSRITNDSEVLRQQFYVATISNVMLNFTYVIGTYIDIIILYCILGVALLILFHLFYYCYL